MAKASSKAKSSEILGYIVVVAVIAVVLVAIYYVYKAQQLSTLPPQESQSVQTLPQNEATPIPSPTRVPPPVWHGKGTFTVSSHQNGPQYSSGTLDPYDPAVGGKQIITLTLTDTKPVQKAWVVIQTDKITHQPLYLQRINGSDLSGQWEATWTLDDTYNNNYVYTFYAQSENGTSKVTDVIR